MQLLSLRPPSSSHAPPNFPAPIRVVVRKKQGLSFKMEKGQKEGSVRKVPVILTGILDFISPSPSNKVGAVGGWVIDRISGESLVTLSNQSGKLQVQ